MTIECNSDYIFAPFYKVLYEVEATRVDQITDYDKLTIDVWSKGIVSPEEATSEATINLSAHLLLFMGLKDRLKCIQAMKKEEESKEEIFKILIENLNLSNRAYNCLKRNGVSTVEELIQNTEEEMIKMRKFGRKSLKEVEFKLSELGLSFLQKKA